MWKAPGTFGGTVTVGPAKARVEDSVGERQQRLCMKRGLWWQVGGWSGEEVRGHHAQGRWGGAVEKVSQDRDPSD